MKVCSIFSQVLKIFSRGEFEKAVKEHKAERHARATHRSRHCRSDPRYSLATKSETRRRTVF